jgi:aminoglycoside phosphotransferase (APT) family kinase protein
VRSPGALLASGRDADVFEYGAGAVLRRSREGRSQRYEAQVLSYLHAQDYPVPEVHELSDDGLELVMERVDGPTMVDAAAARPWTISRQGRLLAELHVRLHELDAPGFLLPSPVGTTDGTAADAVDAAGGGAGAGAGTGAGAGAGAGAKVMHRDLHPLNVMLSPRGPVVIDWAGACAGEPDVDVAIAWVLMAAGELGGGRVRATVTSIGRGVLLRSFLSGFDRTRLAAALAVVVPWKVRDPHMSESEVATMWALEAREASRH